MAHQAQRVPQSVEVGGGASPAKTSHQGAQVWAWAQGMGMGSNWPGAPDPLGADARWVQGCGRVPLLTNGTGAKAWGQGQAHGMMLGAQGPCANCKNLNILPITISVLLAYWIPGTSLPLRHRTPPNRWPSRASTLPSLPAPAPARSSCLGALLCGQDGDLHQLIQGYCVSRRRFRLAGLCRRHPGQNNG